MVILIVIGSLCLLLISIIIYGHISAIKIQEKHLNISSFHNTKILFLSDLHLGKLKKPARLKKDFAQLDLNQIDIVIIGGDLIGKSFFKYYNSDNLQELFAIFQKIKKRFIVLGNHDKKIPMSQFLEACNQIQFKLLVNQEVVIKSKTEGNNIVIYGFDECNLGKPEAPKEMSSNDFNVGVIHQPDYFKDSEVNFDLRLSGHSHGGQITIFGWRIYKAKNSYFYSKGIYKMKRGKLIVSKGIGNNLLALRIFARPDFYIIQL